MLDLHSMKQLENLCVLNIAEYFPQTYMLQDNQVDIVKDLVMEREVFGYCHTNSERRSEGFTNCEDMAKLVDENFKLSDQINMKDEEHYLEVLGLRREIDVLRESGEGVALLRQYLRQRDERILELTSNDVYKKEVDRLES